MTGTATSPHVPSKLASLTNRLVGFIAAFERLAALRDAPKAQLWLFGATLFGSALLLFTVQPMFAKMALPKLGGSPSVWAVSMCFFQAALLAGYCYAHALNRYVAPRRAVLIHLTVLVLTLVALPIGLPTRLAEPSEGSAYIWLIGVLTLGVGLPFFAVSASAPLLQAWFAKTGHADAKDPYFLYGASNFGSLLALLAYPLVIEPLAGATMQTRVWGLGFVGLTMMIAVSGVVMLWLMTQLPADARPVANLNAGIETEAGTDSQAGSISWRQCLLWTLLAAIPSGLMVAVTTYITTDIASAPFMWVIPLALFLATFILVFREHVSARFGMLSLVLPVVVMLQMAVPSRGLRMALAIVAFFIAALVCHRELFLRRPAARHLTAFYLWMSAGGVIGGVFAALLAPQIFTSVFEFQVLLAASLFCVPHLIFGAQNALDVKRIAGVACLGLALLLTQSLAMDLSGPDAQRIAMIGMIACIGVALILTRAWAENRVVFMIGLAAVALAMPEAMRPIFVERSFFGTVRVMDTGDGKHRMMLHGTTLHGARRLKTDDGEIIKNAQPLTYYHSAAPMARGFEIARKAKAGGLADAATLAADNAPTAARLTTGVVGLGTGSLACYAQTGDSFKYYEIDPVVVKIARDPKLFDFVSRCTPSAPMIVGDARLTLAKEANGTFDYLVIDAFSSDTVPVHLITVEALQLYLTKLSPTGLLALHISNRYMDLPSAVASTINQVPGVHGALVRFVPTAQDVDASASHVVLLSRNSRVLDGVLTWPDAEGLPRTSVKPWTDDYSDVMSAVLRMIGK
jgi:hypothetical protein